MQTYKMLCEMPITESLELIVEEKNLKESPTYYIQGPYMMCGKPNKNKRIYSLVEMVNEVKRYNEEYIKTGRALGELNHPPDSTEVDLGRACHMVVALEQKDDFMFYGKSKILSTPCGVIIRQLLSDGVKIGISSRALGKLIPRGDVNMVEGFKLLTLDICHEPSAPALLESIMENRQYIIDQGGKIVELACDSLACRVNSMPKKDIDKHLTESFAEFFKVLKG